MRKPTFVLTDFGGQAGRSGVEEMRKSGEEEMGRSGKEATGKRGYVEKVNRILASS